jgi:hypothetical protein
VRNDADERDQRIPPGETPGYLLINFRARHQVTSHLELNLAIVPSVPAATSPVYT